MSERKIKVPLPNGGSAEAVELSISASEEPWYKVTLSDDTVLRIKNIPTGAIRLINQFDQEGNPIYLLKSTAVVTILEVAEQLRKNPDTESRK
jgi:hypothetical protein